MAPSFSVVVMVGLVLLAPVSPVGANHQNNGVLGESVTEPGGTWGVVNGSDVWRLGFDRDREVEGTTTPRTETPRDAATLAHFSPKTFVPEAASTDALIEVLPSMEGGPQPAGKAKRFSLIRMASCGGAPDALLPFARGPSPWGRRREGFGQIKKVKPYHSPLPPEAELPSAQEFGGWVEGEGEEEWTEQRGNVTSDEISAEEGESSRHEWQTGKTEDVWQVEGEDEEVGGDGERINFRADTLRRLRSLLESDGADGGRNGTGAGGRSLLGAPRVPVRGGTSGGVRPATAASPSVTTSMRKAGCGRRLRRVVWENNGGYGPRSPKRQRAGDNDIRACLADPSKCTAEAFDAANRLPSLSQVAAGPRATLGGKRYRSCALVGNAGHILKHKYGRYIDRHEAVIRFNVMGLRKWSAYVGKRTTFRVLNNARSNDACCRGMMPEGKGSPIGLVLWYPAAQDEMKRRCKRKYPMHKVFQLSSGVINREVAAMNSLRVELQRLGLGKQLGDWRQLSSGGHAILLFSKVCDSISLYGFTAWSKKGRDQYAGNKIKTRSGSAWHDWDGESLAWRLMFAAGQLQICSN